jgi:CBS domain containing-hemolysin-like protein
MNLLENSIFELLTPVFLAVGGAAGDGSGGTWGGLIFYVTLALGISFLCSVLEAILLSTSHSYVEMGIESGSRAAYLMQSHKVDVERPISAILTLNTVAHTVGAAGAGAEAVGIFGNQWFGVISAVLTILILVFSEIIPKTIGATYWKELNPFAAYAIRLLVLVLFPAVWLLEKTTQILKSESTNQPTISRVELEVMARIGASEGALLEGEDRILRNLLHLTNIAVRDIMTPRTVVIAFRQETVVREVVENNPTLPYSRLPIYNESMDDIAGFVLRYEIFSAYTDGEVNKPLIELKRDIGVIPETNSVASALEMFIAKQQHIMLVIDEYGGTAGIITMEDAIETLLGIEITDESDLVADLRKMAEQRHQRQRRMLDRVTKPNQQGLPQELPGSAD